MLKTLHWGRQIISKDKQQSDQGSGVIWMTLPWPAPDIVVVFFFCMLFLERKGILNVRV